MDGPIDPNTMGYSLAGTVAAVGAEAAANGRSLGEAITSLEAANDRNLMPGWREELESMFRDIAFAPDFERQMREGMDRERGMDR